MNPIMEGRSLARYRVLEQVGEGGMGVVYRAHDPHLERDVALKLLPAGALENDEARQRFRREALALSRLNHPNVATIHDFDSDQGVDFLVMEFISGRTLAERMAAGPILEHELIGMALQLAEGLQAAHAAGIVHRDLKPGNIRLTPEGRVKVLDFGLARQARTGPEAMSVTLTDARTTVGTLAYMAPEVMAGQQADARSDVFSVGVVLYEAATGQSPFPADTPIALMYSILHHRPASPRNLNPALSIGLEAVISRALEHEPSRRYATGQELLADLRQLRHVASPEVVAPGSGDGERATYHRGAIRSLAVLPLENLSGQPSEEFFADGMTEALIADLARLEGLRVISRTSVMRYKGARKPLPEIAAELRVEAVLEGSVMRAGDRIRITTQLIDAASDAHLWAESYDRDLRDVLEIQSDVARAIAREIKLQITPRAEARLTQRKRVDPAAHEAFLRGRHHANRRTEESLARGIEYFREAIDRDPAFALAYVGLADAYNLLGFYSYLAPREAFPRAKAAAMRALEVDPGCAEARISVAYVHLYHDWDWAASEREFLRGIELNPGYAQGPQWYLNLLAARGRLDEALAQWERAIDLDPLSLIINNAGGWVFYLRREHERAILQMRRSAELDPTFMPSRLWSAWPLFQLGRHAEAISEIETAVGLTMRAPLAVATLAYGYALAGDRRRATGLLAELEEAAGRRHVPAFLMAILYDALGDRDGAFAALQRSVENREHWLVLLDIEPRFDPLRQDPRFEEIRKLVGV